MDICLIGVDPGPVAGVLRLLLHQRVDDPQRRYLHQADALQVTPGAIEETLNGLVHDYSYRTNEGWRVVVTAEQFVVSPRASRSAHASASDVTRKVLSVVRLWANQLDRRGAYVRTASEVKPWATDVRLEKAGLIAPTEGMRHARDAGRHALFCAVHDCGLPDPLSQRVIAGVTAGDVTAGDVT